MWIYTEEGSFLRRSWSLWRLFQYRTSKDHFFQTLSLWFSGFEQLVLEIICGTDLTCSAGVLLVRAILKSRDRLSDRPCLVGVRVDGGGRGRGKGDNLYFPTATPLLIFDRQPLPWYKFLSLHSLSLPWKSNVAAIIFVRKILSTRSPKLRLLCRLGLIKCLSLLPVSAFSWNQLVRALKVKKAGTNYFWLSQNVLTNCWNFFFGWWQLWGCSNQTWKVFWSKN